MIRILLLFAITVCSIPSTLHAQEASQAPFDEAQVFEWWDDGIITPEEADEIFSRLEEENFDEACLLAEVYAQEPCVVLNKSLVKRQRKSKKRKGTNGESSDGDSSNVHGTPSLIPHGRITWKSQYDSDGHLKKHREELQVQFYYFKLRLGSQELLSYHRDGLSAHFGQISTLELRSYLPLDTLWGTAIVYPVGKFRLGALLDTSKTFHAQLDFRANRENEISASFWKFTDASAIAAQARTTLGQISAWYQLGQDCPLVKIQLQSEKKWLSWKTTAYIHGDSIPHGLNLSKGIAENRLWASQTVNVQWPELQNTILSARARLLNPTVSDSISARFKMTLASGPNRLRLSLGVTCIEAGDNCNASEWKGNLESAWEKFTFKASALFRHEDGRTKPPKIEFGTSYRAEHAFAKLTIALPKANPAKALSVQNEIKLFSDWLDCNLVFTFKKSQARSFAPNYAHISASFKF